MIMRTGSYATIDEGRATSGEVPARDSEDVPLSAAPRELGSISAGTFRPEAHSNWIVHFRDLVRIHLHAPVRIAMAPHRQ